MNKPDQLSSLGAVGWTRWEWRGRCIGCLNCWGQWHKQQSNTPDAQMSVLVDENTLTRRNSLSEVSVNAGMQRKDTADIQSTSSKQQTKTNYKAMSCHGDKPCYTSAVDNDSYREHQSNNNHDLQIILVKIWYSPLMWINGEISTSIDLSLLAEGLCNRVSHHF